MGDLMILALTMGALGVLGLLRLLVAACGFVYGVYRDLRNFKTAMWGDS